MTRTKTNPPPLTWLLRCLPSTTSCPLRWAIILKNDTDNDNDNDNDMAAKMSAIYNELSFKVERTTLKNDNLIREPFGAILVCRKETAKSNLDPTSSMLVQTI